MVPLQATAEFGGLFGLSGWRNPLPSWVARLHAPHPSRREGGRSGRPPALTGLQSSCFGRVASSPASPSSEIGSTSQARSS